MSDSTTPPPHYYPVYLDLHGKCVVVVGGGEVARRKVEGLVEAGAEVIVIAPNILPMPEGVICQLREFLPDDLHGADLVIAATDVREVNHTVAREATARHLWVNVVDDPEVCSLIFPSVLRRGGLSIAVSTGGASPTLARTIREELEEQYGPEYAELVELLQELRREWEPQADATGLSNAQRRAAWQRVIHLPLRTWIIAGDIERARVTARETLQQAAVSNAKKSE